MSYLSGINILAIAISIFALVVAIYALKEFGSAYHGKFRFIFLILLGGILIFLTPVVLPLISFLLDVNIRRGVWSINSLSFITDAVNPFVGFFNIELNNVEMIVVLKYASIIISFVYSAGLYFISGVFRRLSKWVLLLVWLAGYQFFIFFVLIIAAIFAVLLPFIMIIGIISGMIIGGRSACVNYYGSIETSYSNGITKPSNKAKLKILLGVGAIILIAWGALFVAKNALPLIQGAGAYLSELRRSWTASWEELGIDPSDIRLKTGSNKKPSAGTHDSTSSVPEHPSEDLSDKTLADIILKTDYWVKINIYRSAEDVTVYQRDRGSLVWTMLSNDGNYRMVEPDFAYNEDKLNISFPTTTEEYCLNDDQTGDIGGHSLEWDFETDKFYSRMSLSDINQTHGLNDAISEYMLVTIRVEWEDDKTTIFYKQADGSWRMKGRDGSFSKVKPSFKSGTDSVTMSFPTVSKKYVFNKNGEGTHGSDNIKWSYSFSSN